MLSLKSGVEAKRGNAFIDPKRCVGCGECILSCPSGAIEVQWNESIPMFQKKMVEHAYGAVQNKKGKVLYLSFLTRIRGLEYSTRFDAGVSPLKQWRIPIREGVLDHRRFAVEGGAVRFLELIGGPWMANQ